MNWRILNILKIDNYDDEDKNSAIYQNSIKVQKELKSRLRLFIILFPPITLIDIGSMLVIMLKFPGVSYILVGMILISDSPFVLMIYYILTSKAKIKGLFCITPSESNESDTGPDGSKVKTKVQDTRGTGSKESINMPIIMTGWYWPFGNCEMTIMIIGKKYLVILI